MLEAHFRPAPADARASACVDLARGWRAGILAALLLAPLFAQALSCGVTEASLAGAWQRSGGGGPFEQMEFTTEGGRRVFNSWLHERPDISDGSWSLQSCVLKISHPTEAALSFTFSARLTRNGRLQLKEDADPSASFRRIKNEPR